ncbi:MAG TPA: insulinase family protein, partial [Bacteroidia bacterium]|nr:insulinase family protein [Bacteroidia bacterium]
MHTRIYTLDNGLTVFMSVYKNAPRIQTFIATKAGSKFDPHDATGLAHYLEHMLFKGTQHFGTKDYVKEKPLLDEIDTLFEVYRHTTDETKRTEIYHQIDSVSYLASGYAIANEYDKMLASMGGKGSNAFTSVEETV